MSQASKTKHPEEGTVTPADATDLNQVRAVAFTDWKRRHARSYASQAGCGSGHCRPRYRPSAANFRYVRTNEDIRTAIFSLHACRASEWFSRLHREGEITDQYEGRSCKCSRQQLECFPSSLTHRQPTKFCKNSDFDSIPDTKSGSESTTWRNRIVGWRQRPVPSSLRLSKVPVKGDRPI